MFPRVIDMKILIFYIFSSLRVTSLEKHPFVEHIRERSRKKRKGKKNEKENEEGSRGGIEQRSDLREISKLMR